MNTAESTNPNAKRSAADAVPSLRKILAITVALSMVCVIYLIIHDDLFSDSRYLEIFNHLLHTYDIPGAWLTLAILICALAWRNDQSIIYVIRYVTAHRAQVIALATAVLAAGTFFTYHNFALSMDEFAARYQAQVFASGQLSGRVPPDLLNWMIPKIFQGYFFAVSPNTGAVASIYWPGFALLLAPFEWIGAPWLCNPLLAALSLWLIQEIAFNITGDDDARGWALLFAIASPAFTASAISYYSMTAHLALNLAFAWLLMTPSLLRAAAAGVVGSYALVLHNPYPHILFALPWMIWLVKDPKQIKNFLALLIGYLPIAVFIGLGWLSFRSNIPLEGNITADSIARGEAIPLFSRALQLLSFITFPDITILGMRISATVKMWVWAVPGLLVFAVLGYQRFRTHVVVKTMAYSAIITFLGYFFVSFDQGHGWGYRYFHSAWGVVPILAACFLASPLLPEMRRLAAVAGAAALLSLVLGNGLRALQIDEFITKQQTQLPAMAKSGKHILFINRLHGFYTADLIQNSPLERSNVIRVESHGSKANAQLMTSRWPEAKQTAAGVWGESWQLGPNESLPQ